MSDVVDTGVFVSAADTDEPRHADCASQLASHRGQLVTTAEARFNPAASRLNLFGKTLS